MDNIVGKISYDIEQKYNNKNFPIYIRGEARRYRTISSTLHRYSKIKLLNWPCIDNPKRTSTSYNFNRCEFKIPAKISITPKDPHPILSKAGVSCFTIECIPKSGERQDFIENIKYETLYDITLNFCSFIQEDISGHEFNKKDIDLSILQHLGCPTPLLDFTKEIKVALFFACKDSFDKDGRIIILNPKLHKDTIDLTQKEFLVAKQRVVNQSSVLLKRLTLTDKNSYTIHYIPASDKREILSILEDTYGINTKTIFPDNYEYEGKFDLWKKFYKATKLETDSNIKAIRQAIDLYSEIIDQDPNFTDAYKGRGRLYYYMSRTSMTSISIPKIVKAHKDLSIALEQDPIDREVQFHPLIKEETENLCSGILKILSPILIK